MIKSIRLVNFRIHSDSTFNFSEGFNAIVGSNDAGKSSVIIALKWVFINRPLGDAYIKYGADSVKVIIEFDNCTIEREKSKKFNGYRLIKKGEVRTFNVIKFDVPLEISMALNMEEENIQSQFDGHFLLQKSPGEVAQKFNEAADMEIIGKITKETASRIRRMEDVLSEQQNTLEETIKKLEKFKGFDDIHKIYKSLVILEKDYETEKSLFDFIENLLDQIDKVKKGISQIKILPIEKLDEFEKEYLAFKSDKTEIESKIIKIKGLIINCRMAKLNIEDLDKNMKGIEERACEVFKGIKFCIFCHSPISMELSKKILTGWISD